MTLQGILSASIDMEDSEMYKLFKYLSFSMTDILIMEKNLIKEYGDLLVLL
ncbi:MAG: hypothetical protein ACJAWV_001074 [Flammeovirgaceae bacterium]|jgi:hypothetical protein